MQGAYNQGELKVVNVSHYGNLLDPFLIRRFYYVLMCEEIYLIVGESGFQLLNVLLDASSVVGSSDISRDFSLCHELL